ncbi:hypothetical protein Sjap_000361 [Stephania japonica]|uniref:PHD-type domain-containing protein n=1 Tax=Stephania japonica TaxID=461633 RepID=A0AAP0KHW4_9MAGN
MRLSTRSSGSPAKKGGELLSLPGSAKSGRKREKRLDAICEEEYNRNRLVDVEVNEGSGEGGSEGGSLRRSARVRRPPVVLDSSPSPARKRQRVGSGSFSVKSETTDEGKKGGNRDEGSLSPISNSGDSAERGSWKSRLRSRAGNGASLGRRKLFDEADELKEEHLEEIDGEIDCKMKETAGKKSPIVYSRREGVQKVKELSDIDMGNVALVPYECSEDEDVVNVEEGASFLKEDENSTLQNVTSSRDEMVDGEEVVTKDLVENEEVAMSVDVPKIGEELIGVENIEPARENTEQLGEAECNEEEKHDKETSNAVGLPDEQENGGYCISKLVDSKPAEDSNEMKVDKLKRLLSDKNDKQRIREGRRCGLCGRGNDGRPPKRLVPDGNESDNEAYDGLSSSDEANYDMWDGFGDEPGWLGRLLGPVNDRFGIAGVWVHQHCAVWSPEVYFAGLGCLKNVRAALFRGRALKCSRCGRPGATIGCRVDRCPKTYHLPCARAEGCIFDHRKFLIACVDHRHLFQRHGNDDVKRIKKLKAKKMILEMRKLANDAFRKDFESEEKWLENCGEDEEFLKREGKRLHRDLLRIAPVYIGGSSSENEKRYQGWESVAGLQDVIQCMKEVVLLPLLYPEFYDNLGLTPPRGILLHGYPGTGKTLVVRALIGSCARGDRRIAYFAQKGADCLGKYVGDAERQLRLLFQVAERSQPSIIFFDEIDGLAPCRTRQLDQTHNSVVSTLLALMDGLKSRGSVIVIGATNRPEAVDPALRRPGRFDREIYFPLPSVQDRTSILSLHTERWPQPLSGSLLKWIAEQTAGFAGADLQALCTQAAMVALKRNCSLHELMSVAEKVPDKSRRLPLASFPVEEQDWLVALASAPPPCSRREAGMAANDVISSPLHAYLLIPCLLGPLSYLLISLYLDDRIWLPPPLCKAAKLIKGVVFSALEKMGKSSDDWWSQLPDLIKEADTAKQIGRNLRYVGLLTGSSTSSSCYASSDNNNIENERCAPDMIPSATVRSSFLQNRTHALQRKSGFRILIAGCPKSGQKHLASCFLHGFVGHVEIQKVDLATISQEGHGDIVEGVNRILLKCASMGLCVIYMPRVDLWAIEAQEKVAEKEKNIDANLDESPDLAGSHDFQNIASLAWTSFIEQANSLSLSTSLVILATSEVPSPDLPQRVTQFFKGDMTSCEKLSTSKHEMSRFLVQVDGKFDDDMLINSSAAELSHVLIQHYVQLIHCSNHCLMLKEHKTFDVAEGNDTLNVACNDSVNGVISGMASKGDISLTSKETQQQSNEHCPPNLSTMCQAEAGLCHSHDAVPRIRPSNRSEKGKSSLLFAISSFGFQILRYPHFAELCWATSKLKEGPCTEVNGSWKGWPFNSCVIRPNNSVGKITVGLSSSNLKGNEHYGMVRGLVAIGILAYKGVYTSVKEVSLEVRKVLELLVGEIGAKIVAGKDKYRFLRLLSQVAYLEDLVNSWAYTLQSLDRDSQISTLNSGLNTVSNPNISQALYNDQQTGDDASRSTISQKSSQEQSPKKLVSEGNNHTNSSKGIGILHLPNSANSDKRLFISVDTSQQLVSSVHSSSGLMQSNSSTVGPSINFGSLKPSNAKMLVKFLLREKTFGSSWTVEDAHDTVASCSVNIITAIREYCVSGTVANSELVDKKLEVESNGQFCACPDVGHVQLSETSSQSRSSGELLTPVGCSYHQKSKSVKEKINDCTDQQFGLGLNFLFRDSVLIPSDPDKDVLFHCKFESLCLRPLIERILVMKQPLE